MVFGNNNKTMIHNIVKIFLAGKGLFFKYYQCPVCMNRLKKFDRFPNYYLDQFYKYRFKYSIFSLETFNFKHAVCPKCKTGNNNRLYAIYYKKIFNNLKKAKKYFFLDFAPVPALSKIIKSYPQIIYRSADLNNPNVDDKVDIQDLSIYKTNSVDFFLCSHVLEHVENDKKAMKELFRILKPGGQGIIMVPIFLSINRVYENPKIRSEAKRWHFFGQGDHVRVYSKQGFIKRLKQSGFSVQELTYKYFGQELLVRSGVDIRSVLYIVKKDHD